MSEPSAPSGDKRLLVVEAEFARVFAVANRDGATLSPIIRAAYDTGTLRVTTRREPLKADGAHISIIGHITTDELRDKMSTLDAAGGLANRLLFTMAKRSKLLPSGGNLREEDRACRASELRSALAEARKISLMRRDAETEERWAALRRDGRGRPRRPGRRGHRPGDAQTLRLSVTYALLDGSRTIRLDHLEAAYAVWQYCRDSAAYIFGDTTGDEIADRLFAGLVQADPNGLDGTQQGNLFAKHVSSAKLEHARGVLESRGLATTATEPTGGRPRTVTVLTERARNIPAPQWPALKPAASTASPARSSTPSSPTPKATPPPSSSTSSPASATPSAPAPTPSRTPPSTPPASSP